MSNNNNIRYKESRELRDREIQIQIQGYVSRFEPLLYVPAFTQKDFHYVHQGPSTKGPPPRNYNDYKSEYTTPTLSHLLHKRVGTKPRTKQRKRIITWRSQRSQTRTW